MPYIYIYYMKPKKPTLSHKHIMAVALHVSPFHKKIIKKKKEKPKQTSKSLHLCCLGLRQKICELPRNCRMRRVFKIFHHEMTKNNQLNKE